MELSYLPANQAFVFTMGDQLIRMEGEAMFYGCKIDALESAGRHQLDVDRWGYVHAHRELVNY